MSESESSSEDTGSEVSESEETKLEEEEYHKSTKKISVSVIHTLRPKPPSEKLIKYVTELGTLLENTEDEEEKATLIQNANKEIRGMEVSLSCDKNCSFLIQILLKNSGVYQLYQYLEYSYDFMNHLLTDPYASHVMETIFQLIYDFLSKGFCGYRRGGYSEEEREQNQSITSEQIIESVSKIIEKIGGNVSLIASDSCGSHPLRVLLMLLTGKPLSGNKDPVDRPSNSSVLKLFTNQYSIIVKEILSLSYYDLFRLVTQMNASIVLQYMIQLSPNKLKNELIESIIKGDEENIPPIQSWICDKFGSHVLETILKYCTDEIFELIFINYTKGRLLELSNDQSANFFVQKLLMYCRTNKQVSRCSHELRPFITQLLPTRPGVAVELIDICRKFDVKMDKIYHDVMIFLNPPPTTSTIEEDNEKKKKENKIEFKRDVLNNILYYNSKHNIINQYSASLVASLLLYPRTYSQELRKEWFDQNDDYFAMICTDKVTSRNLMEKIMMESGEDVDYFKLKTVKRICNKILQVALNSYGNFVIEKAFKFNNNIQIKYKIASSLLKIEKQLSSNRIGKNLISLVNLKLLHEGKETWIKNMEKNIDRENELTEKKKKRKNEENDENIKSKKAKVNKDVVMDFMKSSGFLN